MKILVTGGAGYIGSFMVKSLLDNDYEVVVLDNLERGHPKAIDKRAKFVKTNLFDWEALERIFKENNFAAVIHFAGYISMEESMENPGIYFYNNTAGALDLIEHTAKHKVPSFIFSSSAGVYGNPVKIPIPETHQTNPTNPYGESKLMVEKILAWYNKIYQLSFVSLRYFNAAGAAPNENLGEDHRPETHIIPLAIKAALTNREFTIFGDDYKTKDGTCVRDYIHVIDLVEAHLLALKLLQGEKGSFFYNVGIGKGYSNKEVVDMVKKITGVDFPVVVGNRRLGDVDELVADPTKIKEKLGWKPKYSDLKTIIETAWRWHKSHPNGYKL